MAIAKASLLKVLNAEYTRLKQTAWFKAIVEDRGEIEIEAVNWDVGTDAVPGGTSVKVNIASENVDDLFEATGRKLNDGLHKDWWRERVKGAPAERKSEDATRPAFTNSSRMAGLCLSAVATRRRAVRAHT
jgi:hypothetical protein